MTAIPSNPTLRPFWVATCFVNFSTALPMIELDLRQVDGTSPHHAESIACRALLAEIGREQAHIICALGKAATGVADVPRLPLPPASGNPAPPKEIPPPFHEEVLPALPAEFAPTPRQRADTLAQARLEVAAIRRDLLKGLPVDIQFTAPTSHKLKAALERANFDPTPAELWNVATTLLGRVVSDTYPLKEADARAVLAFLERVAPERLDILFPVLPFEEAG